MNTHEHDTPDLEAIFDAAVQFGLTEDEVLQAVSGTMLTAAPDTPIYDYLDELVEALSQRILWKQRRLVLDRR
jgi:hypothetical protein